MSGIRLGLLREEISFRPRTPLRVPGRVPGPAPASEPALRSSGISATFSCGCTNAPARLAPVGASRAGDLEGRSPRLRVTAPVQGQLGQCTLEPETMLMLRAEITSPFTRPGLSAILRCGASRVPSTIDAQQPTPPPPPENATSLPVPRML